MLLCHYSAFKTESISGISTFIARFYALIKLEKVEADEMQSLLENLPDVYAAMLCENYKTLSDISAFHHFPALMCWFVTLASKMTGKEIPGVGMAPGGKIVKPEKEVELSHCDPFFLICPCR